jgi:hypothetical protein
MSEHCTSKGAAQTRGRCQMGKRLTGTLAKIRIDGMRKWITNSDEDHLKVMWLTPSHSGGIFDVGTKAVIHYVTSSTGGLWMVAPGLIAAP